MTSANKVSELFTAAGEAFSKLAELAQIIQQTSVNHTSDRDGDESCSNDNFSSSWTPEDTEMLQQTVKRFGDDLNTISDHIKDKTMSQIKSTFKKLQSTSSNKGDGSNAQTPTYTNSPTKAASSFEELDKLRVPVDRSGLPLENSNSASDPLTKSSTKSTNLSNTAISTDSSVLSTQINNTVATTSTSICPSPSPFLHYPLIGKSADITLNRLNARDDSDDENRKAGLSVFNST